MMICNKNIITIFVTNPLDNSDYTALQMVDCRYVVAGIYQLQGILKNRQDMTDIKIEFKQKLLRIEREK